MRTFLTTITLALTMTLCCSTASATPRTETLQPLVEARQQHEAQTRAANDLMKVGYLASAASRYRALRRGLADELASLHALDRQRQSPGLRAQTDRLIAQVHANLDEVMESAQLIRVGPRLARWPSARRR